MDEKHLANEPFGSRPARESIEQGSAVPDQREIAARNREKAKELLKKWIADPVVLTIDWLDKHNGFVTALATVAIAVLTYFVAHVMGGQLQEMQSGSADTHVLAIAARDQAKAAGDQVKALQDQVAESRAQRLNTIAQLRANIRKGGVQLTQNIQNGAVASWNVSPIFVNAGPTNATDYLAWFDLKAFDVTPGLQVGPSTCPRAADQRPANLVDGTVIQPGGAKQELSKPLSMDDAAKALNGSKYILMYGHMEYRDIFDRDFLHSEDWCVFVAPNNLSQSLFSYLDLVDKTQ